MRDEIIRILTEEFRGYAVKRCDRSPVSQSWLVSIQSTTTGRLFAHYFEATTAHDARAELVAWKARAIERPEIPDRIRSAG